MAERTPGPWEVAYPCDDPQYGPYKTWVIRRTICDPSDCANFGDCDNPCFEKDVVVAEDLEAAGAPSDDVMEANARFIATAPEMVAKLIELHAFIVDQYGESEEAEELANLIAKANGRQPGLSSAADMLGK